MWHFPGHILSNFETHKRSPRNCWFINENKNYTKLKNVLQNLFQKCFFQLVREYFNLFLYNFTIIKSVSPYPPPQINVCPIFTGLKGLPTYSIYTYLQENTCHSVYYLLICLSQLSNLIKGGFYFLYFSLLCLTRNT